TEPVCNPANEKHLVGGEAMLTKRFDESPDFHRSVAAAAGELSLLVQQAGGQIVGMTFEEHDQADHLERNAPHGEARWDGSQLPQAISWIVTFAGASGAFIFLRTNGREKLARLMTLAGLTHVKIQAGKLSLDVTGASVDEACAQFAKLASSADIQALTEKKGRPESSGNIGANSLEAAGASAKKRSGEKRSTPARKSVVTSTRKRKR